jgi:hypothetical protein
MITMIIINRNYNSIEQNTWEADSSLYGKENPPFMETENSLSCLEESSV